MPREWSEAGRRLLRMLPLYYGHEGESPARDPAVHSVLEPLGLELQRLEQLARDFRDEATNVNRMTDRFGLLQYHERIFGLPSDDATPLSMEARRSRVIAALRARKAASGESWTDRVNSFIGGTAWTVQENGLGDYHLLINMPSGDPSFMGAFARYLRRITPAHLDLTIRTGEGFVVGSIVGTRIGFREWGEE